MNDVVTAQVSNGFISLCGMGLGLVAILACAALCVTAVVAYNRRKTLSDEMEATLKIEMIERGMSADDIERILHAKMGTPEVKSLSGLFEAIGSARQARARAQQAKPT
jgi:hypothetical protein